MLRFLQDSYKTINILQDLRIFLQDLKRSYKHLYLNTISTLDLYMKEIHAAHIQC